MPDEAKRVFVKVEYNEEGPQRGNFLFQRDAEGNWREYHGAVSRWQPSWKTTGSADPPIDRTEVLRRLIEILM